MTTVGSGHIDRKVAFLKSFLGILGEVIVLGLIAVAFRLIRHLVLMTAPPIYIISSIWLFETTLVWVELAFVLASFTIYCLIVIFVPNFLESIWRAFRAFVEEAARSAFLMLIMFGCGAAIGFIIGLNAEPDETAEQTGFILFFDSLFYICLLTSAILILVAEYNSPGLRWSLLKSAL